jgi:hypothetical protein
MIFLARMEDLKAGVSANGDEQRALEQTTASLLDARTVRSPQPDTYRI